MIVLEPMQTQHLRQVCALHHAALPERWSLHAYAEELKVFGSYGLVAVKDGQVVGFVSTRILFGECSINNLVVAPQMRRQGIGTLLIDALKREVLRRGGHSITLEVRGSNHTAQYFYWCQGFGQAGLRRGFYQNPREDALLLSCYIEGDQTE